MRTSGEIEPVGMQQQLHNEAAIERLLRDVFAGGDDEWQATHRILDDGTPATIINGTLRFDDHVRICGYNGHDGPQQAASQLLDVLLPMVLRCLTERPLYVAGMEAVINEWLSVADPRERATRRRTVENLLGKD